MKDAIARACIELEGWRAIHASAMSAIANGEKPALRIAGGTDEMLRNMIAERILGLSQDHRHDKGVPFNEIKKG